MPGLDPSHDKPLDLSGIDPATQGVVQALLRTVQLQRQLLHRLLTGVSGMDTGPGQAMCVKVLAAHDGISQRDLAEAMHLSRPTVTTMLQRLEGHGVVERRTDPQDQRLTRVYLTPAGSALAEQLRAVFAQHVRLTFGPMSEADRQELERLLRALGENAARALQDTDAPGAAPP